MVKVVTAWVKFTQPLLFSYYLLPFIGNGNMQRLNHNAYICLFYVKISAT